VECWQNHHVGVADAAAFRRGLGRFGNLFAHQGHGVHIDAAARGSHVDGGADTVGLGQRVGQGFDKGAVAPGETFFHQGREAAQKIHPGILDRPVQGDAVRTMPSGPKGAPTTAMGLTLMRLLITGMPYWLPTSSQAATSCEA